MCETSVSHPLFLLYSISLYLMYDERLRESARASEQDSTRARAPENIGLFCKRTLAPDLSLSLFLSNSNSARARAPNIEQKESLLQKVSLL